MKRKIFTLLLALVASVGTIFAESGTCGTNLTWDLTDGVLSISGSGAMTNYSESNTPWNSSVIKKVIISDGVTTIGSYAFYNCSNMNSIEIPNSVTIIGKSACDGCSSLELVNIPSRVATIGLCAFYGCSSLSSIEIPSSVTTIGKSAFHGCNKLTSVTLNSNTIVGKNYYNRNAYSTTGCVQFFGSQVLEYVIGDEVYSIGNYLFHVSAASFYDGKNKSVQYYNNINTIKIGKNVTQIGNNSFSSCSHLTSVHISDIAVWCGISFASAGANPLSRAKHLYMEDKEITDLIIPEGVSSISSYAFESCESFKSVTIPNSVTSIGSSAFSDCKSLTSVTVPNSVTSIDNDAFANCNSLTAVYINDIASWCGISFGNNKANPLSNAHHLYMDGKEITELVIPDDISQIGKFAFNGCSGLKSVYIHENVSSIGTSAFGGCTGSVKLNSNAIVNHTYTVDSNIKNIFGEQVLDYQIGDAVTGIGDYAFNQCSNLISLSIGKNVMKIGTAAFTGCSSLTSVALNSNTITGSAYTKDSDLSTIFGSQIAEYKIGDEVTNIGKYAFCNCTGLTSVTIPSSVTSIGAYAFSGCTSLTSVTIPSSVTSIGAYAFSGCTGLSAVHINDIAVWCGISFASTRANPLYRAKHLYMEDKEITDLIIPEGVSSISSYAFEGCESLKSVTIPNSVTSIGYSAFSGCTGLTAVHINDIAAWCRISFNYEIYLDVNPLYHAKHLYMNGKEITELIIPEGVTSIGNLAFYNCTGLTSVTIPNSVTSIGNNAFYNCSSLTSVTIGNSVTSIGGYAFASCKGLKSIYNYCKTPAQLGAETFKDLGKYACILYVLAESVDLYKSSESAWKNFFYYIKPIGAESATTESLQVTPTENSVAVVWPSISGAATYELTIKDKNGNVICTLIFNEAGQLTEIAFSAPSRNGAPQQTQASGFSFTVTGLDAGTSYNLSITAKDENGATLDVKKQSFHTDWTTAIDEITNNENLLRKVIRNGQVYVLRGDKLYTLQGQEAK